MSTKCAITGREIPSDLAKIDGLRSGFEVPDLSASRLVITGNPGSGKSTLVNSCPYIVVLDAERGGDTVPDPRALRFSPPNSIPLAELDTYYLDFVDKIIERKKAGKDDIKMVALDTFDKMVNLFQEALCSREGVSEIGGIGSHGKGYAIVRRILFSMLDKCHQAGLGWVLIAHSNERVIQVGDTEMMKSTLSVSNSYQSSLYQSCEHILWLEQGTQVVQKDPVVRRVRGRTLKSQSKTVTEKVRKLRTAPGGIWAGGSSTLIKSRVPFEEEIILPAKGGWEVLSDGYRKAVTTLTEGESADE